MSQELQSAMLSRFLKSRRAALSPVDFGLPSRRRRTPGLRREELASLIGVSVSWYTWLEQGRNIGVSASVIERLASVLQLDAAQREYLFMLVHKRPPPLTPAGPIEQDEASPLLWRMLGALTMPALATTYRWDVVAWNTLIQLFRDYSKLKKRDRNLLRLLVTDPVHKANPEDYERKVRLATSRLRFDYSHVGDDPVLDALIDELCEACSVFKHYWQHSTDIGPAETSSTMIHPRYGRFNFEHSVYVPRGDQHLRVIVYFPEDEAAADRFAELVKTNGALSQPRLPSPDESRRKIA